MSTSGGRESRDVTEVVLGVDTHLDFHVAVVLDHLGKRLGPASHRHGPLASPSRSEVICDFS